MVETAYYQNVSSVSSRDASSDLKFRFDGFFNSLRIIIIIIDIEADCKIKIYINTYINI